MANTWDVDSRPVSALLRGQLQLDEVVAPTPAGNSACTLGPEAWQHPQQQATWQLHWDRVQGPSLAGTTRAANAGNALATSTCGTTSQHNPVMTEATSLPHDAGTADSSSTGCVSGEAMGTTATPQSSGTASSEPAAASPAGEVAPQEGTAPTAQQQGSIDPAGPGLSMVITDPRPQPLQQLAEACEKGVSTAGGDQEATHPQQEEQQILGRHEIQQHDEAPSTLSESSDPEEQTAAVLSEQQQEQQLEQQLEQLEQVQRGTIAEQQEQAASSALEALRDSYGRVAAGAACPLDYARLRDDLKEVASNPAQVAQLLQALHWRLCGTPGGLHRFDLITDWVQKDLLLLLLPTSQQSTRSGTSCGAAAGDTPSTSSLEQPSSSSSSSSNGSKACGRAPQSLPEQVLASGDAACQLRLLRLLRAASCSRGGRAYLLQPYGRVLNMLLQQLKDPQVVTRALQQHYREQQGPSSAAPEQQDSAEVETLVLVVSTLQKLALKRRAQSPLIRAGLVPWLVSLLAGDTLTKVDPECPAPQPASPAAADASTHGSSSAAETAGMAESSSSALRQPAPAETGGSSPAADDGENSEQEPEGDEEEDGDGAASAADQSDKQQDADEEAKAAAGEPDDEQPGVSIPQPAATTTADAIVAAAAAAAAAKAAAAAPPQGLQPAHPQDLPAPLLLSATALLLQLVLRTAGAAAAAVPAVATRLLDVAAVLLDTSEAQVHAYTNATLYALFSNPSVCRLAAAKGLDQHLQQLQQRVPGGSLQRQLQHVLARLQKRSAAAAVGPASPAAAGAAANKSHGSKGGVEEGGGSDDEARQDDDEDEPCDDIVQLEQQLAADLQRSRQDTCAGSDGAPAAAPDTAATGAAGAATAQVLLGEQLLEALYPQQLDDPTSTCLSPTTMGRLSPMHPLLASGSLGSTLGAGAGAPAGISGRPGGVYGGWSLPPAQWGTGTHVLQMSGSWGTGTWDASIPGSGVGLGASIAGQLQRGVYAAAQQTQHTLQQLQYCMTVPAPKAALAPPSPGAGYGGSRQSLSATSPVPATSPTPLSRTVHW